MVSITMFLLALDVSGMIIMDFIVEFVFWMMVGFLGDDFLDYWQNGCFHKWNMIVLLILLVLGAGNSQESEKGDQLE
jgi:hypothetical protein